MVLLVRLSNRLMLKITLISKDLRDNLEMAKVSLTADLSQDLSKVDNLRWDQMVNLCLEMVVNLEECLDKAEVVRASLSKEGRPAKAMVVNQPKAKVRDNLAHQLRVMAEECLSKIFRTITRDIKMV